MVPLCMNPKHFTDSIPTGDSFQREGSIRRPCCCYHCWDSVRWWENSMEVQVRSVGHSGHWHTVAWGFMFHGGTPQPSDLLVGISAATLQFMALPCTGREPWLSPGRMTCSWKCPSISFKHEERHDRHHGNFVVFTTCSDKPISFRSFSHK